MYDLKLITLKKDLTGQNNSSIKEQVLFLSASQ